MFKEPNEVRKMTVKQHATLHNVRWQELSGALLERLGFDAQTDRDKRFTLTVDIENKPRRKKAPTDELLKIVHEMQELADPDKFLTDDDLYDKIGAPKRG